MTPLRKDVRTLALRQPSYFDDHAWPTNVVLVLWAGGLGAMAVFKNHFRDPRVWANSWVQLLAVAVALVVSLWVARAVARTRLQRLKLSLVLSLVVHTALMVAMEHYQLRFLAEQDEPSPTAVVETHYEHEVPPEVFIQPPRTGEEKREIEKPLASGLPQLENDNLTATPTAPKPLEAIRPTREPLETESEPTPLVARARRPEVTPMLRSDRSGLRSRRDTASPARPAAAEAESIAADVPAEERHTTAPAAEPSRLARARALAPRIEMPPETNSAEQSAVETLATPERQRASQPSPEQSVAMIPRRRQSEEPAHLDANQIQPTQPAATATERVSIARPFSTRLERLQSTAPLATPAPSPALPDETSATSTAMLPRQRSEEVLLQEAGDSRQPAERRSVDVANIEDLQATTRDIADSSAARRERAAAAQRTALPVARAANDRFSDEVDLPSMSESATSPRAVPRAAPSRLARATTPSMQTAQDDAPRSRQDQPLAQLSEAGSREIRNLPSAPASQDEGSGRSVSSGLQADDQRFSLARAASSVIGSSVQNDGTPTTSTTGELAAQEVPQQRMGDTPGRLRSEGGTPVDRPGSAQSAPASASAAAATDAPAPADADGLVESGSSSTTGEAHSSPLPRKTIASHRDMIGSERSLEPVRGSAALEGPQEPLVSASREPGAAGQSDSRPGRQINRAAAPLAGSATLPTMVPVESTVESNASSEADRDQRRAAAPSIGRTKNSVPVFSTAEAGPGGFGPEATAEVGLPDRRATRQAELAHAVPARLTKKHAGGRSSISGAARVPAAAFSQRGRRHDELSAGGEGKPSAKTEAAIELGLEFLARLQLSDGRWAFEHVGEHADLAVGERPSLRADAAATGLALLSFLGAGYDHYDDKYQAEVQQGLHYLMRIQDDNGQLFPEDGRPGSAVTRFYGHGIAALALCEALGMTGDAELRGPAQRALDYIAATQHPQRGGWRYVPGVNSDLSVTGWQLMALRSGQLAGLSVRPETFEQVEDLVEACREEGSRQVRFCYNPWASVTDPRTRHGRQPSTVMTSVGLLSQLYLGSNRDNSKMQGGADHLLKNLPKHGNSRRLAATGTLGNPLRDTYYWYYATQVMFHMGGDYWKKWNDKLHPLLVDTQTPVGPFAGSWNPQRPVPDKWGTFGGRLYVTTMNLLSLEVYYRHLPLYEMTAQ